MYGAKLDVLPDADMGVIAPGCYASMFLTRPLPSLAYLQYAYTEPLITRVILKGDSLLS